MIFLVQRVEMAGKFDEFEASVESVELESGIDDRRQYHIRMIPTTFKVSGVSGAIHEWIGLSPRATEEAVPQGSVVDRYLMQLEICMSEVKNKKTVGEALKAMVGHKFKFKKLKLGKDFNNQQAKEYIVPVALIK